MIDSPAVPAAVRSRFWRGVWRVADPKITLASVAGLVLGAAAAARDGPLHLGWLALTVIGIFFVEAAKNASGEVFDWDSGADQGVANEDRSPFSGGKRVLVDGLWSRRQAFGVAFAFYALAAAIGIVIVTLRQPSVLAFGLVGIALAFFYHAPPFRLSYRGLGELAVGIAYGPVITTGTYLVQRGTMPLSVILLGLPLGLAIAAFLWINEFPDLKSDAAAGKRTLVVRLGPAGGARAFAGIIALVYLGVVLLPFAGLPWTVLLGLAGLPLSVRAARRLVQHPETTSEIIAAQGWTLLSFLLLSAGASVGLLLATRG